MSPSFYLWFCAFKRATLGPELQASMGPRRHLWFCAGKRPCLASEILVSIGSSLRLSFLEAKQRLLDQNNKSLMVPDNTVVLCIKNSSKSRCFQSKNHRWGLEPLDTSKSDARYAILQPQNHRIISLYGSQTSPVVLYMQYSVISNRNTSLYGFQPSSVVLFIQNSDLRT